jgi:hypothetical protein
MQLGLVLVLEYMPLAKGMWTPARPTSHSKITGINMELPPPFAAITASTILEGFPPDVGTSLQGLASIQPQEH